MRRMAGMAVLVLGLALAAAPACREWFEEEPLPEPVAFHRIVYTRPPDMPVRNEYSRRLVDLILPIGNGFMIAEPDWESLGPPDVFGFDRSIAHWRFAVGWEYEIYIHDSRKRAPLEECSGETGRGITLEPPEGYRVESREVPSSCHSIYPDATRLRFRIFKKEGP